MKTLIQDIKINSVEEAEEILKAAGTEDLFEKARTDGEMHPNGRWVWRSSANNGKGDWRVANPKKGQGSTSKKNESGNDIISRESSKHLLDHITKMGKEAKGILYHYDGTRVSKKSIEKRIFDSKVNSASILDVVGTKGEDKIDRSAMKDDKIAGSYMVKYKEKEGMYDLYKFKVSKKVSDEKSKNSEPETDLSENKELETLMKKYSTFPEKTQANYKKVFNSIQSDGTKVVDLLSELSRSARGSIQIEPSMRGDKLEVTEVSHSFWSHKDGDNGDKRVDEAFKNWDKIFKKYDLKTKISYGTAADSTGGGKWEVSLEDLRRLTGAKKKK